MTDPQTDRLLTYCAYDCVNTAKLRSAHLRDFIKEDPAEKARITRLYKQHLRTAKVAAEMSWKGFPVDEAKRKSLTRECLSLGAERASELARLVRPFAKVKRLAKGEDGARFMGTHFRISATGGTNENDLRALLFGKSWARKGIETFNLDVPMSDHSWTETGLPSVSKNALLMLLAQPTTPDEAKRIVRMSWKADAPLKAISTYLDSDKVLGSIGPDGYMHAGINSCATETGRWSSQDPNLFNLSEQKKEEEGALQGDLPNFRAMYVAPNGWVIVHRDFKQLELEVMACLSGDKALRTALDSPKEDVHTARARLWFNIPDDQPVPKMIRRQGKVVGFACVPTGTKVALLDGAKPIEKCKPGDWTWCWNGKRYACARIKHVVYQGVRPCVRITMYNENEYKTLIVTGNHKMILHDGTKRRADQLVFNDRLMPFRRRASKNGYCRVISVEPVEARPVWDLEVDHPAHNFALEGSVFVSNSQYGGGFDTIYIKVLEQVPDAPFDEIQALHASFPEFHVGIAEYWETTLAFAEAHGYNNTPIMDRRRYYPPEEPIKVTDTSNYGVQGGGADVANSTMVGIEEADYRKSFCAKLDRHFPRAWLAMHVYDSFDVLTPKKDASAIDAMMAESMAGPWQLGSKLHTLKSSGVIAERWSEV